MAAKGNGAAVAYLENGLGQTAVLPVGTLVHEALTPEQLRVFEQYQGVTVADCYIDMEGGHAVISEKDFTESLGVFFAVFIVSAVLLHTAGAKVGFFPRVLPQRKKPEDKAT